MTSQEEQANEEVWSYPSYTSVGKVVAKIGLYNTDYPHQLEHEIEVPGGYLPKGNFYVYLVFKKEHDE